MIFSVEIKAYLFEIKQLTKEILEENEIFFFQSDSLKFANGNKKLMHAVSQRTSDCKELVRDVFWKTKEDLRVSLKLISPGSSST